MNKVHLIGNITSDITLRTSSAGKSIAPFSLAVRRKYPDQNGEPVTDFHNCVAFGKLADNIVKYVKKGNKLYVDGELVYDTYDTAEGTKKVSTKIMVENVEFLTPKGTQISENEETQLVPVEDDDLPF